MYKQPSIEEKKAYNISEWVFVAGMMAFYLMIACAQIRKPGIQYDEVTYGEVALGGVNSSGFIEHTIKVMGKTIPTMTMPYIGALKAYVYMPVFKFFGVSPLTIRLPAILLAALSLLFTYLFTKRTFGKKVAQIALVLTAIDPSFVFHTRLDWGPVDIMLLLKMASLYFMALWIQTQQTKHLALGGFLNGLAMFHEATFIWHLGAMGLAIGLVFRKEWFRYLKLKNVTVFSLFFLLGAAPLIQYNIATDWKTFTRQPLVSRATIASVPYETGIFVDTLNGSTLYERINSEPFTFGPLARENKLLRGNLLPLLLLVSIPFVLWQRKDRWVKVLLVYIAIFVMQMFIILMAGSSHHFMITYPFPQIIVAWALMHVAEARKARAKPIISPPTIARVALLCLALVTAANLYIDFLYLKSFVKTGGRGFWSDAIYDLTRFAEAHPDKRFILADWGLNNQLLLLSKGTIRTEEICWAFMNEGYQGLLRERFEDPSNLYVFYAPQYSPFPEVGRFHEEAKKQGCEERLYKSFYQRDGQPVYVLYEVIKP